ncbi:MAG: hypothetical protein CME06_01140 [Gemmatimonadetes bacterium]|nr:hypothetical protein [Gemmatimonadota bacterium]
MPLRAVICRIESASPRHFEPFLRFPKLRVAGSRPVPRSTFPLPSQGFASSADSEEAFGTLASLVAVQSYSE